MNDTTLSDKQLLNIFKNVTNNLHEIFFVYDPYSRKVVYINNAFSFIFHQSADRLIMNPSLLIESIHEEDTSYMLDSFHRFMDGEELRDIRFRIVLDDGQIKLLCLTPFFIQQPRGKALIAGYLEDITKRKEYNDNLKKTVAKKDSVLEILSHDLAAPLNNIQGLSAIVAKRLQSLQNPEINQMMASIIETSQRSIKLIRDFVSQEFLEATDVELRKQRIDIVEKINQVIDEYQQAEQNLAKSIRLLSSDESIYMMIDEVKFMQVINNLISNALKFTQDDGVITITLQDRSHTLLIKVADNGIGIPKSLQKELFNKFTRARRPGLRGEPSTGLGMSIIKTIVEWHQGKIWVESEENQGTTFFIELPKE
jgi:two-component system, OmpR family, sensor histidine kinase VicK